MTAKGRSSARKTAVKGLKLKKETLKDLDAKKAKGVRGGMLFLSGGKGCVQPANPPIIEYKTQGCEGKPISPPSEFCGGK